MAQPNTVPYVYHLGHAQSRKPSMGLVTNYLFVPHVPPLFLLNFCTKLLHSPECAMLFYIFKKIVCAVPPSLKYYSLTF